MIGNLLPLLAALATLGTAWGLGQMWKRQAQSMVRIPIRSRPTMSPTDAE